MPNTDEDKLRMFSFISDLANVDQTIIIPLIGTQDKSKLNFASSLPL